MRAAAAWLLPPLFAACGAAEPAEPPHVILLSLDTVRADHLGCYGAAPGPTPRLDALAERGPLVGGRGRGEEG